jgi:hypothetical protein
MRTAPKVFLNEFEYVRASFMIIPVAIEEVLERRKRRRGFLGPIAVIQVIGWIKLSWKVLFYGLDRS